MVCTLNTFREKSFDSKFLQTIYKKNNVFNFLSEKLYLYDFQFNQHMQNILHYICFLRKNIFILIR